MCKSSKTCTDAVYKMFESSTFETLRVVTERKIQRRHVGRGKNVWFAAYFTVV
jgi:hypothetical protein